MDPLVYTVVYEWANIVLFWKTICFARNNRKHMNCVENKLLIKYQLRRTENAKIKLRCLPLAPRKIELIRKHKMNTRANGKQTYQLSLLCGERSQR